MSFRKLALAFMIMIASGLLGYLTGRYPKILYQKLGLQQQSLVLAVSPANLLPEEVRVQLAHLIESDVEIVHDLDDPKAVAALAELSDLFATEQVSSFSDWNDIQELKRRKIYPDFLTAEISHLAGLPLLWTVKDNKLKVFCLVFYKDHKLNGLLAETLAGNIGLITRWSQLTELSTTQKVMESSALPLEAKPSGLRKYPLKGLGN